jgi:sRNA-binding carbon storage regulator CsrA
MLVLTRRPAREVLDVFSEIILQRGEEVIRVRLVECSPSKARIGIAAPEAWTILRGDANLIQVKRKAPLHDATKPKHAPRNRLTPPPCPPRGLDD